MSKTSAGRSRRALLTLAFAGVATTLSACGPPKAPPVEPLKFSILSTENASAQRVKWGPFLDDLSKAIGRPIQPFFASSYAPLIEGMRFGQTDVGWFSNQPGLEAVRRADSEVFAHTTHPNGHNGYESILIVKKGSGLTLDTVLKCDRTLTFGMGDAKSTSGTLAPKTYLFEPRGLRPETCFKTVRSASHEANLLAVANGLVDAAANNTNDIERQERLHNPALAKLDIIWRSPPLPEDPMVWRKALDPKTKAALSAAILSYGSAPGAQGEHERKVLTDLNFGPFKPATNDHLLRVREMEATLGAAEAKRSGDAEKAAAFGAELKAVHDRLAQVGG
ncbi:phosphate/phosphite/phosphonate ABC transporter substrate-binding protein [soil metagenome]